MNIETKKTIGRYCTYILFWVFIFGLGFYLGLNPSPAGAGSGGNGPGGNNGSADHGTGTGNADHGTGSGSGSGDQGSGKGSDTKGPGSGKMSVVWKPEESSAGPPVKTAVKSKTAAVPKKTVPKQKTGKKTPIRVFDPNDAAGDVASIYVDQKPTGGGSGGGGGTAAGFFGVKFSGSDRVIFLLDVSGSMQTFTKDGSMSRLDLVKKEMVKSLEGGYRDAKRNGSKGIFKVVCFSFDYIYFPNQRKNLSFASNSDIRQAKQFIRQLTPNGGTFMLKVWHGLKDIIRNNEIGIVYFLSDGEPGDCNPPQLLEFLKGNFKRLKIHTISMGTASDLMRSIAKQHKGIYREVY